MKKYRLFSTIIISILLLSIFPITASANSSWHWISATNPLDVFPIVALLTLAIETILTKLVCRPTNTNWGKLFFVITFANLLSFLVPYTMEFYVWLDEKWFEGYTFFEWVMKGPFYTTGVEFLIITLLAEVPVVFLSLRKKVENKKRLLFTVIGINVISTLLVAIIERILCFGSW